MHSLLDPVGCPGEASSELLLYTVYALTGMFRFHTGWIGEALCGAWQKMQICCSLLARIAPRPDAERLCGVREMTPDCAEFRACPNAAVAAPAMAITSANMLV